MKQPARKEESKLSEEEALNQDLENCGSELESSLEEWGNKVVVGGFLNCLKSVTGFIESKIFVIKFSEK